MREKDVCNENGGNVSHLRTVCFGKFQDFENFYILNGILLPVS